MRFPRRLNSPFLLLAAVSSLAASNSPQLLTNGIEDSGPATAPYRWWSRGAEVRFEAGGRVRFRAAEGNFRLTFPGGDRRVRAEAESPLPGTISYYTGHGPADWQTGRRRYGRLRYRRLYPGIDVVFRATAEGLEYDLEVDAGADPGVVRIRIEGARASIRDGDLRAGSTVIFRRPVARQGELPVACSYVAAARSTVRLALGPYDGTRPLIVDPSVVFTGVYGGAGYEAGHAIAVDASGNSYIAGESDSLWFGWNSRRGARNAFVAKVDSTGTLLNLAYFGNSGPDVAEAIALDSSGNVYVAGTTSSTLFPVTTGAYQMTFAGSTDGFVMKLASDLTMTYSTLLGNSRSTYVYGVAVDGAGSAYAAGATSAAALAGTSGFFQPSYGGGDFDCFVIKVNPAGTALSYATYLGGSAADTCRGIAVDSSGNAVVAGTTYSANFPTYAAVQSVPGGDLDGFVAKLNASGTALTFSTFLGGTNMDEATAVALDASGNIYVAGDTGSFDFPTLNAYQATRRGLYNAFVVRYLLAGGTYSRAYSTLIGGSGSESTTGVAVDTSGQAVVAGFTTSLDFPVSSATQASNQGVPDGFLAVLGSAGNTLVFGTYLGGSGDDRIFGVTTAGASKAHVTGATGSSNFPFTTGTISGGYDAFVAEIKYADTAQPSLALTKTHSGNFVAGQTGANYTLTASNSGPGALPGTVVTLTDSLPSGLSATAISGTGWSCTLATVSCTQTSTLNAGASFPPVTLTVSVNGRASGTLTNVATVSASGASGAMASDATTVVSVGTPALSSPSNGASGVAPALSLAWSAASNALSYDVYFGTSAAPPYVTSVSGTSYSPGTLSTATTYYWRIVARNGAAAASSSTFSFTTASSILPTVGGASPASGFGYSQSLAFTFTFGTNWQNLEIINLLINTGIDGRQACYIAYVVSANTIYLVNDAGAAGGPFAGSMTLNGFGSVSNSQCTIRAGGSSVAGSGGTVTMTLNMTFSSTFAGNQIFYAAARSGALNSGWQAVGTWSVPTSGSNGPYVSGMSPAHATTAVQTYVFTFADTYGWQDLAVLNVLVNTAIDGRQACYLAWVPAGASSGTLYLVDDAGDAGGPFASLSLPGSTVASNSQCSIDAGGSRVTASGNTLNLTLAMTFKSTFRGNLVFYLAARSGTQNSGWQAMGTAAVP